MIPPTWKSTKEYAYNALLMKAGSARNLRLADASEGFLHINRQSFSQQ